MEADVDIPFKLYFLLKPLSVNITLNWAVSVGFKLPLPLLKNQSFNMERLYIDCTLPTEKQDFVKKISSWAYSGGMKSLGSIVFKTVKRLIGGLFDLGNSALKLMFRGVKGVGLIS